MCRQHRGKQSSLAATAHSGLVLEDGRFPKQSKWKLNAYLQMPPTIRITIPGKHFLGNLIRLHYHCNRCEVGFNWQQLMCALPRIDWRSPTEYELLRDGCRMCGASDEQPSLRNPRAEETGLPLMSHLDSPRLTCRHLNPRRVQFGRSQS